MCFVCDPIFYLGVPSICFVLLYEGSYFKVYTFQCGIVWVKKSSVYLVFVFSVVNNGRWSELSVCFVFQVVLL